MSPSIDPQRDVPSTLGQTPHEPKVRPWELELLISGALVFGMMQLPGRLDAWFDRVEPSLAGNLVSVMFVAALYVKMALYAVIVGFVLHLAIRAYWVGVIGLEAVFPGGIVWEKARSGPILREVQRRATPSLQALIDGADRLASLVFACGLIVAMLFCFSVVMVTLLSLASAATFGRFAGATGTGLGMEVFLFLLIGPLLAATLVDRRWGDRLDPGGRPARTLRAVGRTSAAVMRYTVFQPLLLTVLTNLRGQRRAMVLLVAAMVRAIAFAARDRLFTGRGMGDGYAYLPDAAGRLALAPRFYEDKRAADEVVADVPSIQSDMVRDPYVRLFIPYRPRRHNALLASRCRALPAGAAAVARPATEAAEEAVLRCMAALQPVTLNGRPVAAPFRFYTQPGTGVRGIAAYIPVAGLPRGENVLRVGALARPDAPPGAKPAPPFVIPFWL